jgi:hypothetical protein
LQVQAKSMEACTGNTFVKFAKSYNGTDFETVPSLTLTVPMNGTTVVKYFSASQVDGVFALKLDSIQNTNAQAITNITIGYLIKR